MYSWILRRKNVRPICNFKTNKVQKIICTKDLSESSSFQRLSIAVAASRNTEDMDSNFLNKNLLEWGIPSPRLSKMELYQ